MEIDSEQFVSRSQVSCKHLTHRRYTQRKFDILKGFEMVETRCINCHKILDLQIRKFGV